MKITAIIPASGRGTRMQSSVAKQYMELCGKPLLYHTIKAFEESTVDEIILVVPEGEEDFVRTTIVEPNGFYKVKKIVVGGEARYNSVFNGLLAAEDSDYVLIHDGARPLADAALISRCIEAVQKERACIAAVPVKDTIKEIGSNGTVEQTIDRSKLYAIQTPQCFEYPLILTAYSKLFRQAATGQMSPEGITDDASVVELMTEQSVKLVQGDYRNIKVTTPEDIVVAEALLKSKK